MAYAAMNVALGSYLLWDTMQSFAFYSLSMANGQNLETGEELTAGGYMVYGSLMILEVAPGELEVPLKHLVRRGGKVWGRAASKLSVAGDWFDRLLAERGGGEKLTFVSRAGEKFTLNRKKIEHILERRVVTYFNADKAKPKNTLYPANTTAAHVLEVISDAVGNAPAGAITRNAWSVIPLKNGSKVRVFVDANSEIHSAHPLNDGVFGYELSEIEHLVK